MDEISFKHANKKIGNVFVLNYSKQFILNFSVYVPNVDTLSENHCASRNYLLYIRDIDVGTNVPSDVIVRDEEVSRVDSNDDMFETILNLFKNDDDLSKVRIMLQVETIRKRNVRVEKIFGRLSYFVLTLLSESLHIEIYFGTKMTEAERKILLLDAEHTNYYDDTKTYKSLFEVFKCYYSRFLLTDLIDILIL